MSLDFATLASLRDRHPAWRLLASAHAPLVASFLHRVFVAPNVRVMSEADLAEGLEDELFALREQLGAEAYPKGALEYLNDWAAPDKGWLRKFYKPGTDEAQFDLTPATEKAIAWLLTLTERPFVGTESRLLTLFALLEQISAGTEVDPVKRANGLREKRDELDAEIARVLAGDMPLLDDTSVKDRFQQFQQLARELLDDFREVEHNFRLLDRKVREKIALWGGTKGALLDQIMSERDAIAAHIEACWRIDPGKEGIENLSAVIKVLINRDGSVQQAQIVDMGRYFTDSAFRTFANSARNAVLSCGNIPISPQRYDALKDLEFTFRPQGRIN